MAGYSTQKYFALGREFPTWEAAHQAVLDERAKTAGTALGGTGTLQEAIAAEGEQRTAERGEAKAAVQPAIEAAAALPTEAFSGADIARQQSQAQAQFMGGAAGYTPSPFSGRQQGMAESARQSAIGRYAQVAPQIDLAGRQANIATQQARAAQMGVVGVGLASALSQVPTTMSPYQAAMIAMQSGESAGYGSGTTGGTTSTSSFSGGSGGSGGSSNTAIDNFTTQNRLIGTGTSKFKKMIGLPGGGFAQQGFW